MNLVRWHGGTTRRASGRFPPPRPPATAKLHSWRATLESSKGRGWKISHSRRGRPSPTVAAPWQRAFPLDGAGSQRFPCLLDTTNWLKIRARGRPLRLAAPVTAPTDWEVAGWQGCGPAVVQGRRSHSPRGGQQKVHSQSVAGTCHRHSCLLRPAKPATAILVVLCCALLYSVLRNGG